MTDHARLTQLVWPTGAPEQPTAADKAEAAAWIDAWFERDTTLCPVWKANSRADLVRTHAETVMNARLRREARHPPMAQQPRRVA